MAPDAKSESDFIVPVDETATGDVRDPGAMLRAARDATGLSVPEIAARLKLTVRLIEVIEANDRRRFPPTVYLRGYVRNYARLLGLDPEPLIEAFALEQPSALQQGVAEPRSRLSIAGYRPLVVAAAAGGLMAAVLLVLLILLWPADENPGPADAEAAKSSIEATPGIAGRESTAERATSPGTAGEVDSTAAEAVSEETVTAGGGEPAAGLGDASDGTVPESRVPVAEGSPATGSHALASAQAGSPEVIAEAAAAGDNLTGAVAAGAPGSGDGVAPDLSPAEDGAEVTGAGVDLLRVRHLSPLGDEELWFDFAEDCWVEVFDTEGEVLYQNLLRRRQSLRLVGAGPFQIRLGYAPGVTLEYNGEPVPLAPHTRNNVALLVVGQ